MDIQNEISELVNKLSDAGHTDEAILIGLTAAAISEGRELELHQKLEEVLPEYSSNNRIKILLKADNHKHRIN
jgi:hypothetical protein